MQKKAEAQKPEKKLSTKVIKPGRKDGRPTKYTEELAQYVCDIVSSHSGGIPTLCKQFPIFPDESTIYLWRMKHEGFSRKYTLAKQAQAEIFAEEIIELSDSAKHCTYADKEGNLKVDQGSVAAVKLQVDSRKWLASKLIPKIYGDQKQIDELKGQNDEMLKELLALRAELAEKNKREY